MSQIRRERRVTAAPSARRPRRYPSSAGALNATCRRGTVGLPPQKTFTEGQVLSRGMAPLAMSEGDGPQSGARAPGASARARPANPGYFSTPNR
jgi:hypothetical protein